MAFREGLEDWLKKSQAEGQKLLESYAKTCRGQKVINIKFASCVKM